MHHRLPILDTDLLVSIVGLRPSTEATRVVERLTHFRVSLRFIGCATSCVRRVASFRNVVLHLSLHVVRVELINPVNSAFWLIGSSILFKTQWLVG